MGISKMEAAKRSFLNRPIYDMKLAPERHPSKHIDSEIFRP